MAIIPLPDVGFRSVKYRLRAPAMVNRSEWTGARQVMGLPGPTRLGFSVEHVPLAGEPGIIPWRAFFARLEGPVNTFRMPVTETPQVAADVAGTVVAVPGLGSLTLRLTPADARTLNRMVLLAGQIITILDQPLILTTDLVTGGGDGVTATVDFRPLLRRTPAAGTAVRLHKPTALVAIDGDVLEWGVEPGQRYGFSLEVSEAF